MTDDEAEADVIVINTCCFIHDAMEESIQNILEMAEYRKSGQAKALIVAGCLASGTGRRSWMRSRRWTRCSAQQPLTGSWTRWMRPLPASAA